MGGYPGIPPMFPFMPGGMFPGMPGMPPPADMARIAQRAQSGKGSAEEAKPPPEPAKPVVKEGMTATDIKVVWKLEAVKEKLLGCGKTEGVESPSFIFKMDGTTGPPMTL